MKKITILVSSVRKSRAADNVLEQVKKNLTARQDVTTEIIDLRDLKLPIFDDATLPASEEFEIPYESVKTWSQAVKDSDGVVMLTPEYNHSISAAQKNAIDWLYSEWADKPVALVAYNWGATYAVDHLAFVFEHVKAKQVKPVAHLAFKQDIELDGSAINQEKVDQKLAATFDELLK